MPPLHHTSESWAKKTATLSRAWYKPGDILYTAMPEHVCVLEKLDEKAGTISTFDYGLWDSKKGKPAGRRCVSRFRAQGKQLLVGNKLLRGWLDISRVPGLLTPS
jgi:hypothetical protein